MPSSEMTCISGESYLSQRFDNLEIAGGKIAWTTRLTLQLLLERSSFTIGKALRYSIYLNQYSNQRTEK